MSKRDSTKKKLTFNEEGTVSRQSLTVENFNKSETSALAGRSTTPQFGKN